MVTGIFTCYAHVYMKVLNCGYIYRVALDTKVCTYGMYIWYLSLLLSLYAYLSLEGWAAMNLSADTLTTQRVA